jgi:plasmid maintenance system antidote protein VapI
MGSWINLQAHLDLEIAKHKVGRRAARISPKLHDADGKL